MESHLLIHELGELDNYLIENKNSYQLSEVKYPNFNDVQIDHQLRYEITFDSLIEDINSSIELLDHLEKNLLVFFYSERQREIEKFFKKYDYNQINFLLYSFLLRRKISLIYYMLQIKLKGKTEFYEKTINETYITMTADKLRDIFVNFYEKLPLKIDDEVIYEFTQIIQNNLDHEKIIYLFQNNPSLSSIGICLKFLKSLIHESLDYYQILIKDYKDDKMIEFLYSVNPYLN